MKALTVALLTLLTGCATCERHPVMCSTGAAILVSAAASAVTIYTVKHDIAAAQAAAMAAGQRP